MNEDNKGQSFEKALLSWLKDKLGDYDDINLDNGFKSESFHNGAFPSSTPLLLLLLLLTWTGKVILGLINEFDDSFINYSDYNVEDSLNNCEIGLTTGEEKANVPAIVDAGMQPTSARKSACLLLDELAAGKVSEKNLVLYLSLWFNAFKERDAGLSKVYRLVPPH